MKVALISVASLVAAALAHASAPTPSATNIQLTLNATPSFSLDGIAPSTIPDPWGRGFVIRKKAPNYQPHRPWLDTPGSAMRLQFLRFEAGATGKPLPALNPELRRQK